MMRRLLDAWDRFWFDPIFPLPLGLLRIALVGFFALPRVPGALRSLALAAEKPIEWIEPALGVRLFFLPYPMPEDFLGGFGLLMRIAGFCALAGIFTRLSLFIFSVGFLYLAGGQSSWGFFGHTPALPAQILLILALAPGVDALSLDRWIDRRDFCAPAVPAWGLRLVLVLLALIYFSAGVSKLRYSGLEWTDGHTLGFYMKGMSRSNLQQFAGPPGVPEALRWKDGFGLENYLYATPQTKAGAWALNYPPVLKTFSILTLVTELFFPLVIFGGWLRTFWLLAGAFFHLGSEIFLKVDFRPYLVVCLLLIDWEKVFKKCRR